MSWWQYLILVNLYLAFFYVFYGALLRMETFFHLNRIYLVASALLSFLIPLIHNQWVSNLFITQKVQQTISFYAKPITVYHALPAEHQHMSIGNLLIVIYATGALVLAARLISQLISLRRLINEPEPSTAFAFFKNIRIGSDLDNEDIIVAHEDVHARQWHSADVMLIEAIAIINWFNPVVYFYKFGIKHIHEFIADRQALKNGTTKAEYALLLLSQTLKAPTHDLVTPFFNGSLLKRRIIMLHKSRSGYTALMKYGLSAPLFVMMLVLSSAAIIKSQPIKLINKVAERIFGTPASYPGNTPKVAIKVKTTGKSNSVILPAIKPIADSAAETVVPARAEMLEVRSSTADKLNTGPTMATLEREPQFKGGMLRFYQFLALNLHYPEKMMRYNIQGKVVIAMTVEKDGS
ncbi:MAG TPA: M56 family metallopeptidase, partial [Mucilaginibacter sp.]|nr:M56 family metallopeptidase [Mucilaginibacter sp.]